MLINILVRSMPSAILIFIDPSSLKYRSLESTCCMIEMNCFVPSYSTLTVHAVHGILYCGQISIHKVVIIPCHMYSVR